MKEIGVASFLLSVALIGVVLGLGALQNTSVGLNNGQCEKRWKYVFVKYRVVVFVLL